MCGENPRLQNTVNKVARVTLGGGMLFFSAWCCHASGAGFVQGLVAGLRRKFGDSLARAGAFTQMCAISLEATLLRYTWLVVVALYSQNSNYVLGLDHCWECAGTCQI